MCLSIAAQTASGETAIEATDHWQATTQPATRRLRLSGRWLFLAASILVLLLLGLLPPLISVNRYQHRLSTSISSSLGRPVHFDSVSLNLLPLPSFTFSNFVVEEDPAFGAEPVIRADAVTANLRVSSLWRRPVEFSRISFADPSINLVHDARGKWNVESILLQAAHIQTAPTAQARAGAAPRFPYIEATGARFNLKQGFEKTPFSLSEADFALWLPDPQAWRMRIKGRPIRTDTSVSDTGSLQIEATLGRAASLDTVPLDLQASWRDAPLGQASRLLLARDLGLRGDLTATASIQGNLSQNSLVTHLQVNGLRRSDFVPDQTLALDLECTASATRVFHTLSDLRCSWPVPDGDGATLALAGSVPDILQLSSADLQLGTSRLPASVLLTWLRVLSSRMPPTLKATGLLSGSISHDGDAAPAWTGQSTLPVLSLSGAKFGSAPFTVNGLFLHSEQPSPSLGRNRTPPPPAATAFLLSPINLPLGGKDPALLEGSVDARGYSLHLSGMIVPSRLLALAAAVPQIGDGLPAILPTNRAPGPVRLDISAHRDWTGEQLWTDNLAHPSAPVKSSRPAPHRRR